MLELHEAHANLGAQFAAINGSEAVAHYGSVAEEYRALTTSAAVLDLSFRGRLVLLGADRAKFLHGQVTNNIRDLKVGQGAYAALVTAKAKVQSDLNVYALQEELLLDFEPGLSTMIQERLEKFIIADDVQVADAAPHYSMFSVQGPLAARAVAALQLVPILPAGWMTFTSLDDPALGQVYVMNRPRFGSAGFDLFIPIASAQAAFEKAVAAMKALGGTLAGWDASEIARVEAGIPRFPQDMNETNLAPEAGIESIAISYTKGCYIGQEIISRLRAFGQVTKALRKLDIAGAKPEPGDKLLVEGKEVGYITSAVQPPGQVPSLALAYVRKDHNAIGNLLTVQSSAGNATARIVGQPYAGSGAPKAEPR